MGILLALLAVAVPLIQAGLGWQDVLAQVINAALRLLTDEQKLAFEHMAFAAMGAWLTSWDGPDSGAGSTDEQRAKRAKLVNEYNATCQPQPPRQGPYVPLS
jgi:hypothetical protein